MFKEKKQEPRREAERIQPRASALVFSSDALTGNMEHTHRRAFGLIPPTNCFGCREQINLTMLALKVVRRLIGERNISILSRPNDQVLYPFLIDVFGFIQRDNMRCAVLRLGKFFLAFFYLTIWSDDDIVLEEFPLNGDRAKRSLVNLWLHRTPSSYKSEAVRNREVGWLLYPIIQHPTHSYVLLEGQDVLV